LAVSPVAESARRGDAASSLTLVSCLLSLVSTPRELNQLLHPGRVGVMGGQVAANAQHGFGVALRAADHVRDLLLGMVLRQHQLYGILAVDFSDIRLIET